MHLVPNPDTVLSSATATMVTTADAQVLDRCGRWFALSRHVVRAHVPAARVVDLSIG